MANITGLDKAKVLVALHKSARVLEMGLLQAKPNGVTEEEARELLKKQTYFDYLEGRIMKIEITGDEIDTWLYNRDNGQGAAEKIINSLK